MPNNIALNERQIRILVLPHWYQTWWAKMLLTLAIVLWFFGFFRFQMKRQLEKQESIRLRDLDNLKMRLYTNITHEFRTPLTVIMGMNDNILGHEQERGLIRRNARNLLRLINQLLDLSKLDSGTLKMDAVQGDIIAYLQYLTESFYSMASDKKVNLNFKADRSSLVILQIKVRDEDGRLHKALELLRSTDLQISEIAYDVGFSDPSYFTRMFRQEFGKAPGEVR